MLVLSSLYVNAQATCTQTFTVSGKDNDPTVLTINATDLTCNAGNAPTAIKLVNANISDNNCPNWYGFNLSVDGASILSNQCNAAFNNIDITGFTTLNITSQDNDNWAAGDNVTITIDVEVTFTPTAAPTCDAVLISPANGVTNAPLDGNITWSGASGGVTGYNLTVGTTPGGTDVLATTDVGNVTTYALGALPQATQYYITIQPYNAIGDATGCTEQGFTTFSAVASDITTYTEAQLISEILIENSDCATVSNIQFSSHSTGADTGIGYFNYVGSGFPFSDGVILSSGKATAADGPYVDFGSPSFSAFSTGDTDLETILGITGTNDATYIEFDFVPVTDNVSFNFLMASSEYDGPGGSFQCTYEDAFAFILTDAGGTQTNLAILPTTNTGSNIVSVTNIHPDVPGNCAAANEIYFDSYSSPGDPTAYQGRTVPLTATTTVIPGQTYHIKLVVADNTDSAYDTTIFLEGGSFGLGSIDLGSDVFLGDPAALCQGDTTTLNAGVPPVGTSITWTQDGNPITGTQNAAGEETLTIDTTGDYSVTVSFDGTTCSVTDTVHIEFYPNPNLELINDVIKCANEDLLLEANVTNANVSFMNALNYQWSYNGVDIPGATNDSYTISAVNDFSGSNGNPNGTAQFTNPITNILEYINVTNGVYNLGDFTITVTDSVTGCAGEGTMNVSFYENANCVIIPSGISPNRDGVNDCIILDDLDAKQDIAKIQVFNRYGTQVFTNNNYVKEWCGTNNNGDLLPTGTYYYVLEFADGRTPLKGWVYINREI